ncbi:MULTISPECIES: lipopolysaccharide assembly protein LapA domain-containing protein [unclassified Pseudomonas]|uniref:lipopolysaccharide assembly protein LapA domain-containing protein n=1 Tax=unclassified Pseudomonas TaxID=196821 RepID=UPI001E503EC9|nr:MULTISPECIES: LapA family protein [unclassified Pseudomonas]MEB0105857.1 LapA family protein [Pseudomonas sp. MH9.3]WPX79290.1 LapA family protein [Pseudomonas sp. MH9.3]WQG58489.1 LapA family protein [Pseudomonas sp. RTB3]
MRGVKRVVAVFAVLIVALIVLAFVLENQQGVSLSFLGQATRELPVSVFVVVALIVGMVIGPLLGVLVGRRHRRSMAGGRS